MQGRENLREGRKREGSETVLKFKHIIILFHIIIYYYIAVNILLLLFIAGEGTPRRGRQAGWAPDQGGEGDKERHCRRQTRTTHSTPGKEAGTCTMRRRGRGGGRREDERERREGGTSDAVKGEEGKQHGRGVGLEDQR